MTTAAPDWLGDVSVGVDAWTSALPAPHPAPPDTAAQGPEADPEAVARKILLDQLTGQARSRKELADKLAAKNVPDDVATRLLDRFEEVGLIDDEAFARAWIASRGSAGSGSGRRLARRALAQELRRKGIDRRGRPRGARRDRPGRRGGRGPRRWCAASCARWSGVDDTKATRRLVGMLARKGYGSGLAFAVVRDELAAQGARSVDD